MPVSRAVLGVELVVKLALLTADMLYYLRSTRCRAEVTAAREARQITAPAASVEKMSPKQGSHVAAAVTSTREGLCIS
jgi:hypothetical protein